MDDILYSEYIRWIDEYILSMKVLIRRYKEAIKLEISKSEYEDTLGLNCLLCYPLKIDVYMLDAVQYRFTSVTDKCKAQGCPWIVITGVTCFNPSRKVCAYNANNKDIIFERIEELKEWIKIYQNIKEKLSCK